MLQDIKPRIYLVWEQDGGVLWKGIKAILDSGADVSVVSLQRHLQKGARLFPSAISTVALPGGEVEYPVIGEVELNLRLFMNQDPTMLKNALSLKNARFIVVDAPQ